MRNKAKKEKRPNSHDPRLAADVPTANSAEFVPSLYPDQTDTAPFDSSEIFDFIPEIKGNKFS
ncbi:MAG: hypothetical protein IJS90_07405 [Clostridia bacterium]|nr:hypothetical protein [Clostridia bacterium]